MKSLPVYIDILFIATTILAVYFFWKASGYSKKVLIALSLWLLAQAKTGLSGFYQITDTIPPRMILMIVPPVIAIILLFTTAAGRRFIDGLDLKILTLMNVIRVPVEAGLLFLFLNKAIPGAMTFEGRNFDIFSGITAPLIYYFGFVKQKLNPKIIIAWNFICLGLVLNVVVYGILSAPSVFQKFSFDQPNIGILYFPYVWLPALVVPLVLFSHLASIRRLIKESNSRITRSSLQPVQQ